MPAFGHSAATLRFWRGLARPLVRRIGTPFYLFSLVPIEQALRELEAAFQGQPVRPWLSCKTQPLRPLLQWWQAQGRGIEVVSEFEFQAALHEGFPPERILVNGPAKHHWLPRHGAPGLRVNFDSTAEARALAGQARRQNWSCGVRLHTRCEHDPEDPRFPTQFGLEPAAAKDTIRWLQKQRARLETVHFHLRTNVATAKVYQMALAQVAAVCRAAGFAPRYVDCGGGFPPRHVWARSGHAVAADFDLTSMREVYARTLQTIPSAEEIWIENGRWLSAGSGILVVRVLDQKQRGRMRHLICDGGRTLNALVSTWEDHALLCLPERRGPATLTTVAGPTCMAFDQLARRPLPRNLRAGDHLAWLDAGAYHLPWETRFSHGHAAVFWHDGRQVQEVRTRQTFEDWWKA